MQAKGKTRRSWLWSFIAKEEDEREMNRVRLLAEPVASDAAKQAMDFILEVYKIERAAPDADLPGTPEHLEMRQATSRAVMDDLKAWLDAEKPRHPPKGPMGEAINYALGRWDALTLFLTDPHLPIDNNASERALRVAPRPKELPLRRHERSRREPRGPVLARRHVRGERRESRGLPRRCAHPRAAALGHADRRTAAAQLEAAEFQAVGLKQVDGDSE